LSLEGTPAWSLLAASGAGPAGRIGMLAAVDAGRDRLLVHGGGGFADDWALDLRPGGAWSELHPLEPGPGRRAGFAGTYDPGSDRLLVIGGGFGVRPIGDVWALSFSSIITASAGPGGSIRPAGQVAADNGADRTFTITADSSHAIADVSVDGVSVGAVPSYTFSNLSANHRIDASFASLAPALTTLRSGYPNPSPGAITFALELATAAEVHVTVYDVRGARVRTLMAGLEGPGRTAVVWDGTNSAGQSVTSGIYIVRMDAGAISVTRRVARLR